MINVALIGLGYWGKNYLKVLQNIKGIKLSYVCDSNPEALKNISSYVKTTLNYEEIAKDEGNFLSNTCFDSLQNSQIIFGARLITC